MSSQSYHQREIEERIRKFDSECVAAVRHIGGLQERARSFLSQLSCGPTDLKNRFLQCTKQLDVFMYTVTEFNLTAISLETEASKTDTILSKHQNGRELLPPHSNIQQLPTNERASYRKESKERKYTKQSKRQNWREKPLDPVENTSNLRNVEKLSPIGERESVQQNEDINTECPPVGLPPQPKLAPGPNEASIVAVDGNLLWVVVDDSSFLKLVEDMNNFYQHREIVKDFIPEGVCVYYDETDTKFFLRAFYIEKDDPEVFLVDTGEFQPAVQSRLCPLVPQFAITPPLAHLCHLADINQTEDTDLEDRQTEFMKQFLGQRYKMKLVEQNDDNDLESLAAYVYLDDGTTINELLAQALSSNDQENPVCLVEDMNLDEELDYSKCPEYENAVEAVTGYNNRDEIDICKHYKGGDGCFKGSRCKKRHVKMHPDGWTLDRVPVTVKCRPAPLPAPGTWHKVKVTHVEDTCRFYVHFESPEEPMSLADLVDEMTLDAENSRPLQLEPAPGELVSARFSDGRYYRARVLSTDHKIEVMYIDYGNTSTVSPSELRSLEPRWLTLPARAAPCRLAGVTGVTDAGGTLRGLVLDKTMEALVIACVYDELTLKLVDLDGFDVGEQFAAFSGVMLHPYAVESVSQRCIHLPA